jgi:hypothetical protein
MASFSVTLFKVFFQRGLLKKVDYIAHQNGITNFALRHLPFTLICVETRNEKKCGVKLNFVI